MRVAEEEALEKHIWVALTHTCSRMLLAPPASGAPRGILFENIHVTDSVEENFLRMFPFENIAYYTLLKEELRKDTRLTPTKWIHMCEQLKRSGRTVTAPEKLKKARYTMVCGKQLQLETCNEVSDRFHDSLKKYGCVKTRGRNTCGLCDFGFPSCELVSKARKKLFFLLGKSDQVKFCLAQVGDVGGYKSPDDISKLDEVRPFKKQCVEASKSREGSKTEEYLREEVWLTNPKRELRSNSVSDTQSSAIKIQSCVRTFLVKKRMKVEKEAKERIKQADKRAEKAEQELEKVRRELEMLKTTSKPPDLRSQLQTKPQEVKGTSSRATLNIKIEEWEIEDRRVAPQPCLRHSLQDQTEGPHSDDDSVTSAEREEFFRKHDEELEMYEKAQDQREIEQYGMETHQKMKRRRLSQHSATHVLTFLEFRNAYRTMRDKRNIQIELRVWLPVFFFAAYFAVSEALAAYIHEQGYLYPLDDPRLGGDDGIAIYAFIFLCSLIMVAFFAVSVPTACDWFYGLIVMPATRLCFPSNQGYASMIIIVLLCSQKIKWLLALEFLGVVAFIILAPLANRFIFIARLVLTTVFYQNRLINHIDHRTPTIFLSVWRELILTVLFAGHWVFDKLELFFCGCAGHE